MGKASRRHFNPRALLTASGRRSWVVRCKAFYLCKRLLVVVGCLIPVAVWLAPPAMAAGLGGVAIAPHRAVYDMTLNPAPGGGTHSVGKGRMVYEIKGGACRGYNVSMRWVTERSDNKGEASIEDLRYVSWEAGNGDSFTFSSTRYLDRRLVEEMQSGASKAKSGRAGEIQLSRPEKASLPLPLGTIFPTEHLRLVIAGALSGKTVRTDRVYDVSDDGKAIYDTFTLISPLAAKSRQDGVTVAPGLDKLQAWSATISYFQQADGATGEAVPVYEQTFALYANGVTTQMRLGTPKVTIDGKLKQIEFLPVPEC